jgi:acetoacetate decarboxylase
VVHRTHTPDPLKALVHLRLTRGVEQELADLANPWTSPAGLLLQQHVMARVWDDPALDVYDHD